MQKQVDLTELASVDIQKVSKEELVDASNLHFDPQVPQKSRAAYLLNAIGNPYCFRVGELSVKLEFAEHGPSLQDVLFPFFREKRVAFDSIAYL